MRHRFMLRLAVLGVLFTSGAIAQPVPETSAPTMRPGTCQKPVWPAESISRGESGTVTLKFLIDEQGKVLDSTIRTSSGYRSLDDTARRGIARCEFNPARRNGQPVRSWFTMQYMWDREEPSTTTALDSAKALREAGEKGDVAALYKLSSIMRLGTGVKANPAYATKLLQQAADKGHGPAINALASFLEEGTSGYTQDVPAARRWSLKGAELGDAAAQFKTGMYLLDGTGGAPKDVAQGAAWLRKAADQGHAPAANELAQRLDKGAGMAQDRAEAARLLRGAVEKDDTTAKYGLAVALLSGGSGRVDAAEATRWLTAAAQDRHGEAELLFAELKLEGKVIARDEVGGMKLLRRAAEGGNGAAMVILGALLARGVHTAANADEGREWTAKAPQYGSLERPYATGYFRQLVSGS